MCVMLSLCTGTLHLSAGSILTRIFVLSFVEDQKVSAPDVALYGLHVIIPLMSSEVLKVSPPAPPFSLSLCESGITSFYKFPGPGCSKAG